MKIKVSGLAVVVALFSLLLFAPCYGQQSVPADKALKIEGAKMAPVNFSHKSHAGIDCAKCHHKGDPQKPQACSTCHDPKVVKSGAPAAKDAFHNTCIPCHKEKGGKAPTKCNECHKKQ